jgi:excisionase family DNA binding protein
MTVRSVTFLDDRQVYTVEEAGKVLGLSRASSYQAAARGDIPTIRIGRRLLVPIKGLELLLEQGSFRRGKNNPIQMD